MTVNIFAFAPEVSLVLLAFLFIGYTLKHFHEISFYKHTYRSSKNAVERIIKDASFGLAFVFIPFIYLIYFIEKKGVRTDTGEDFILFTLIVLIFEFSVVFGFISGIIRRWLSIKLSREGIVIRTEDGIINGKRIYDSDEDFLYYLTLDGNWSLIRKDNVHSVKHTMKQSWVNKHVIKKSEDYDTYTKL